MGQRTDKPDSEAGASLSFPRGRVRAVQPASEPPVPAAGGTSSDASAASEQESDRESFARTLTRHPLPESKRGGTALDPTVPRTFTVDGGKLGLSGQLLIDVYEDGVRVAVAWRPDSYGSTLWGPPVEAEPDPWTPEEIARRVRPLTDDIGRGTRP